MKILTTVIITAAAVVLIVVGYAYSGLYDVSASSAHSGFVKWLLSTTSEASIERRAVNIEVPALDDNSLVLAGINDFDSMCAGCHGAPGRGPDAMGQGLNPRAPDLAEEATGMTPAELFWVTKHGIRMTGMPAWGTTHDDDAIWPVVAFVTRLPEFDETEYQQMLSDAQGHGHHAGEAPGQEHSHDESGETSNGVVHVHADGSEHVHEQEAEPGKPAEHDHELHEQN